MKKFIISMVAVFALGMGTQTVYAQQNHNYDSRATVSDADRKQAEKDAKKEAKKLEKEGWEATPGTASIYTQLLNANLMRAETDPYYVSTWSWGGANASSNISNVAHTKAAAMARADLAANLKTTLTTSFEQSTTELTVSDDETSAMQKVVTDGMEKVTDQVLTHIKPVIELYRKNGKQTEYWIRLAYSSRQAMEKVLNDQQEDIMKMRPELRAKIEEIRGF